MPRKNGTSDIVVMQNALKTLAANIRFSSIDHPAHSMCVVSSIPSEGKTTISVGLGKAFAAGGSSVILVECDLRRRSLATALGVHGAHGIYSVLSGNNTVQESVVAAGAPNLYFLDAEPSIPNPADLVQSKRFKRLVSSLVGTYDYVIIDTPPVNTFVDAAIVSSIVDATVLVVRQDYTRREDVRAAFAQLQQAGANVIGTVLNCADTATSGRYYYYYDYYHRRKGLSRRLFTNDSSSVASSETAAPGEPTDTQKTASHMSTVDSASHQTGSTR